MRMRVVGNIIYIFYCKINQKTKLLIYTFVLSEELSCETVRPQGSEAGLRLKLMIISDIFFRKKFINFPWEKNVLRHVAMPFESLAPPSKLFACAFQQFNVLIETSYCSTSFYDELFHSWLLNYDPCSLQLFS